MTGIVVLVLAVLVAVGFGLHRRRIDGRFDEVPLLAPRSVDVGPSKSQDSSPEVAPPSTGEVLAATIADADLGSRATLVQFSSAFCAPCRTTRVVLADVADSHEGVHHLEIDAEQHLALVRRLGVRRTPTTLVLDAAGRELLRAAGAPRREQVLAALPVGTS